MKEEFKPREKCVNFLYTEPYDRDKIIKFSSRIIELRSRRAFSCRFKTIITSSRRYDS